MKKTRCHPTKGDTVFCLVGDYAISENLIMANRVLIDAAAIAGVALDGVDNAVFDFLDDANMISLTVLWAGAALVVPIEEDNHAGRGLHGVIRPLPTLPEPLDTVDTACELRNDTGVDIAAYRTPRHACRGLHWTACRRYPESRWYRAQGTARSASLQAQAAPAAYRGGCRE